MPDRILVIEDDEATRYSYERALLGAGYPTIGYPSYFAAAAAIDQGVGMLLVVDLQLPPGHPTGCRLRGWRGAIVLAFRSFS